MATVRTVAGTALHLACFPDLLSASKNVCLVSFVETKEGSSWLKGFEYFVHLRYWVWTATGDLQTHMRVLFSSDAVPATDKPYLFPVPFQCLFQCLLHFLVALPAKMCFW